MDCVRRCLAECWSGVVTLMGMSGWMSAIYRGQPFRPSESEHRRFLPIVHHLYGPLQSLGPPVLQDDIARKL